MEFHYLEEGGFTGVIPWILRSGVLKGEQNTPSFWNASKGSIILFFCTMSSPFVLIIPGFPMITQFQQIASTR